MLSHSDGVSGQRGSRSSRFESLRKRTWVEVVEAAEDGGVELADAGGVARGALAGLPVALDCAQQGHLDHHHRKQGQRVVDDAPWHREVVQGAAIQHLRAGLEPGAALDRCAIGLRKNTCCVIEMAQQQELQQCMGVAH